MSFLSAYRSLALLAMVLLCQCKKEDDAVQVYIPDQNFLGALLDAGVDQDGDGRISQWEAESTSAIIIGPSNIKELKGIEAFIHLDTLVVKVNPISVPDLSANTALRYLAFRGCGLTHLDVSKNGALKHLDCSGNEGLDSFLESLDLSGNPELEALIVPGNELGALDVSQNPGLLKIDCSRNRLREMNLSANLLLNHLTCTNNFLKSLDLSLNTKLQVMTSCGNQLSTLNLSQNTLLKIIGFDNMPSITEVCVWTLPFPPEGVRVLMEFSPNAYFTTACRN